MPDGLADAMRSGRRWKAKRLKLARRTLEPYGVGERVTVDGPSLHLAPQAGVAMAMVLNELATNAAQHGALSGERGQVGVNAGLCTQPGERLRQPLPTRGHS